MTSYVERTDHVVLLGHDEHVNTAGKLREVGECLPLEQVRYAALDAETLLVLHERLSSIEEQRQPQLPTGVS